MVEASALFARLREDAPWRQEWLALYGRRVAVPRMVAWCGEAGLNYRYSGADHTCTGWLPELADLRRRLADRLALTSNFVLLNRYRNGSDYMGWHSDDERGLASTVASVSLGARRRFLLRPPVEAGGDAPPSQALDLEPGSLLLFDGSMSHSLPRTRRPVGERINLTFRLLHAESS